MSLFFRKKNKSRDNGEINPDEIFLDSSNLPDFDTQQFEGRIEKPISKKTIFFIGIFFSLVLILFSVKLYALQIKEGGFYLVRGENNRLEHSVLFSERGIIYDKNNVELAWNSFDENLGDFPKRNYLNKNGFSHLLGYVGYPLKDSSGNYYETETTGKAGIEKLFDKRLKGENGLKIVEVDALMKPQSELIIKPPKNGEEIHLTIDAGIQEFMYNAIDNLSKQVGFKGGAGVIMDVENGEILSIVSYPEYSSDILTNNNSKKEISSYFNDPRNLFLNRATSGLYTPGSIVKPFMAVAALTENIITPEKQILSTGSISLPNPYHPELPSVFKDWKAHGWTDMRRALAVSSDVYFYAIGGGFQDQKGLGIDKINKYMQLFGFGSPTGAEVVSEEVGLVPSQEWKKKVFDGENWSIGNTYHTSIGQYGFQVTLLQAVRAVGAIANDGILLNPIILPNIETKNLVPINGINKSSFKIVREGMRNAVTEGTAQGLSVGFTKVAAKTGTAELGVKKDRVNAWITGFFPYDRPKYAFAVIMESGPVHNTVGGLYIMRQTLEWMSINRPEYFK